MIPKIEKEKQEEQKKSQKDRNGIIGGLVFGAISFFFAYQAYKILFEFLIGKILVGIFALLTLIFIAVSISCFFDYKESKKIEKLEEDAKREEKEFLEIDKEKRSPIYKIKKALFFPTVIWYRLRMKWFYCVSPSGNIDKLSVISEFKPRCK